MFIASSNLIFVWRPRSSLVVASLRVFSNSIFEKKKKRRRKEKKNKAILFETVSLRARYGGGGLKRHVYLGREWQIIDSN